MISLEETKLSQVPEEAQSQMPTMHGQSLSCLSFTVLATRSPHPKVDMMEGRKEPADERTEGVSSQVLRSQSGGSGCKSGSGARNCPPPFFVAPLLSFAFICNFEERGCSNRREHTTVFNSEEYTYVDQCTHYYYYLYYYYYDYYYYYYYYNYY